MASSAAVIVMSLISCCQIFQAAAFPQTLSIAQYRQFSSLMRNNILNRVAAPSEDRAVNLGKLASLHVVGIETHPEDPNKLVYADDTAIYEFDKMTGKSSLIAGGVTNGIILDRQSQDGIGEAATFVFITKLVSRRGGLYIFDYDRLRKLDLNSKAVTTISTLSTEANNPIIGDVSENESDVFWCNTAGQGHFVMRVSLSNPDVLQAELVVAGPTLIGYMELSPDGRTLYMSDVEMQMIEKVTVADGDVEFVTEYGDDNFYPGSLAVVSNTELISINRGLRSVSRYDVTADPASTKPLCGSTCMSDISNPLDITVDRSTGDVYVLDGAAHPMLPTYQFYIKKISAVSTIEQVGSPKPSYTGWMSMTY